MDALSQQRCYQHADREAVVRCPECRRFFCRECVTEHDDRMLCSECLKRLTEASTDTVGSRLRSLLIPLQGFCGFILLWYIFFWVGQMLLAIPHTFHEGTIWQSGWWITP